MQTQQPPGYPNVPPPPDPGRDVPRRKHPRRRVILGGAAILVVGVIIGSAAGHANSPAGRTVTQYGGLVTVTPSATVTVTAAPKAAPRPAGTTMGADGTAGIYVVGQDIKAGTWHTTGAIGGGTGDCYVALLSSTSSNDIIDNDNVTGPDTITVSASVKAVQVNGCETWYRTGP